LVIRKGGVAYFPSRHGLLLAIVAVSAAAIAVAQHSRPRAEQRIAAPEARQGAASDGSFAFAIDSHRIGKYAIASGRRVGSWHGDPKRFPHINSCTLVGHELVCAASNYPALPPASSVEFFDADRLVHRRSVNLGVGPGWLTAMDRHRGRWWAVFANYDGRRGQAGRDHRSTRVVRMNDAFRPLGVWTFPPTVLERLAPNSVSGASWTADGRLTATGHDRPKLYVVAVPPVGTALQHVATVSILTPGQAIDWDPRDPGLLWSIDRKRREIVASRPALSSFPDQTGHSSLRIANRTVSRTWPVQVIRSARMTPSRTAPNFFIAAWLRWLRPSTRNSTRR
jgi:hypothetical protein